MSISTNSTFDTTSNSLKDKIYRAVSRHPGWDAEDVATWFGIPDALAVDIVGELLNDGLLEYVTVDGKGDR